MWFANCFEADSRTFWHTNLGRISEPHLVKAKCGGQRARGAKRLGRKIARCSGSHGRHFPLRDDSTHLADRDRSHTTEAALALASILISHSTCAFGLMGANVHVDSAKRLVRWAVDRGNRESTKRDIFCAFQSTFKSMENLEPGLRLLGEHHYLHIEERPTRGRPSQACHWNPAIFGAQHDRLADPTFGMRL